MWVWILSLVPKIFIIKFQTCSETNLHVDLEDNIFRALGSSDDHISPKYKYISILNPSVNYQFSLTELFELRKSEININLRQIFKIKMEIELSSVKFLKCVASNGTTLTL